MELKTERFKKIIKVFRDSIMTKWFLTGVLITLLFLMLAILYIMNYHPTAFVYSAF